MYTFLIAASNADPVTQARADWVCGGANDEATIHTALAALPASGGSILLSEGTFYIDTLLNLNVANVALRGCGPQATRLLIGTGLQFGIQIAASYSILADLWVYSVDGDNGSFALGTHLVECSASGLEHLQFHNLLLEHGRNGLRWRANQNIFVDKVHCKDLGGAGIGTMGGSAGLPENITVSNCIFEDVTGTGLTMNPVKNATVSNITIFNSVPSGGRIDISSNIHSSENITISNVVSIDAGLLESAVGIDGASSYPLGVTVSNCVCRDYHSFPAVQGSFYDIEFNNCTFESSQYRAINIIEAEHLKMSNITVNATGWSEVALNIHTVNLQSTPGANIANLTVVGSSSNTSNCLYFDGADVRIINGVFEQSQRHGIYAAGVRATIDGCTITDNQQNGIWVSEDDGKITNCVFRTNSLEAAGTYDDITVPAIGGWLVHGNRFYSTQVGRHYDESSATGDPCLIVDNIFAGTPIIERIRLQKTGSVAYDNLNI